MTRRHASLLGVLVPALVLGLAPLRAARSQVTFERAGFRLTSLGERISVSGRVVDAGRRPVPSGSIRWRVADPSIASVTPQGVITSRKVGNTKLWAVAGNDSASALILVDQWAAKFDFIPASVRLDAKGQKTTLRIIVRDAGGFAIASQNRKPASCRSLNDAVATLSSSGDVTAVNNGVTYVRCADRGIADSVRVEVRQRPARAIIADKPLYQAKVLGDTFRLKVGATDASGGAISNVQSTWASLNPTIVTIDPVTGFARGVAPGTARIVAQAGDATDTVSVGIAPNQGAPVPLNSDSAATASAALRMPTIRFDATYPFIGDTTAIRFQVRDASGVEIPNPRVELASSDTSVFTVLSRNRILPKRDGSAYVLGRFGEVVDSGQIIVRARTTLTAGTDQQAVAVRPFVRPSIDSVGLRRMYATSKDSVNRIIFDSTRIVGLKAPWFLASASLGVGQTTYSFTDSTGQEERSGLVYGGSADLRFRFLRLTGELRTGTLATSGTVGPELTVTEGAVTAAFVAGDGFAIGGSGTLRAMRDPLAIQQWMIPRAFVSVRPAFVGGALRTIMGVNALLPGATYTGYLDASGNQLDPQPLSLGGEMGLEYRVGSFKVGMLYNVESFRFEKVGTSERRDQFSTVRIRAGWQYAK